MTTIYNSAAPAKTTTRPFGRGVLRSLPTYKALASEADMAWYMRTAATRDEMTAELEQMALEAEAVGRLEAGYLAC